MSAESPWSGVRSLGDLLRVPCLQSSLLVGLGCAGCMLAHKLHIRRKPSDSAVASSHAALGSPRHALVAACLTLGGTSAVHFGICFSEHSRKKELIREAFGKRNIKEAPQETN